MKDLVKFALTLFVVQLCFTSCANQSNDKQEIVLENIASRKSVRSYTSQSVSEAQIEKLLRAAMAAPSARNRQPWEFIVVNERVVLDSLAARLKYAKMLREASLAIVVCAESVYQKSDGTYAENKYWEHDASAAAQNILLAAEAMGLGAVWTAASDQERSAIVKSVFNLPSTIQPLCVIPIGYPSGEHQPIDKWKPSKIHYNRW